MLHKPHRMAIYDSNQGHLPALTKVQVRGRRASMADCLAMSSVHTSRVSADSSLTVVLPDWVQERHTSKFCTGKPDGQEPTGVPVMVV